MSDIGLLPAQSRHRFGITDTRALRRLIADACPPCSPFCCADVTSTAEYLNDQHSATLWNHDHTLGITRLNVYAGLAGFYLLQDSERLQLQQQAVLPGGSYDLGMAIQDRAFTADGQLYYPAFRDDPLPGTSDTVGDVVPQAFYDANGNDAPSAVPEFFGDTILAKGHGLAKPRRPGRRL